MGRAQKLKQQRKEEQAKRHKAKKKEVYRKIVVVVVAVMVVASTVGLIFLVNRLKKEEAEKAKTAKQMVMETSKGEIVIDLFTADTPLTVAHISTLVENGSYNNLLWYRVEDFVAQTGSSFQSLKAEMEAQGEITDIAPLQEAMEKDEAVEAVQDEIGQPNVRGAIAMAKPSDEQTQKPTPNSAKTDFYILKTDASWLNSDFTVFGRVVQGMDVVDSLEKTDYLISTQIRDK